MAEAEIAEVADAVSDEVYEEAEELLTEE